MRSDRSLLQYFLSRLSKTDEFWSCQSLPFEKFVNQEKYLSFMYDTGSLGAIAQMTGCSPEILFEKMIFFPPRIDTTLPNDEKNEISPYSYLKVFKNRKNFINMLHKYLGGNVDVIGVITVNRHSFDDDIRTFGVFVHDKSILHTFTPKMFTDDNWIHGWPWPNFGTAFFVSLDLSWALYSTNLDDDSLIVFMADKSFTQGFFFLHQTEYRERKNDYNIFPIHSATVCIHDPQPGKVMGIS